MLIMLRFVCTVSVARHQGGGDAHYVEVCLYSLSCKASNGGEGAMLTMLRFVCAASVARHQGGVLTI